mgnify:CR=1 FL=1
MEHLSEIGQFARLVESLGIVGILTILSVVFIYLHIKELRLTQQTLNDIDKRISDLIDSQKDLNQKLFALLMERRERFKD